MRISFFFLLLTSPFLLLSCSKVKTKAIPAPGQVFRDVVYATAPDAAGKQQSLAMDIYLPASTDSHKTYPLMLMIHGGGFNEGDKKEMSSHCSLLADSGYIGVSINYRLGWKGNAKKCEGDTLTQYYALYRAVQDANAALRFLVSKRADYHIDTSRLFIGGGSAGGTIAMYTQYIPATVAKEDFPEEDKLLGSLNKSGNSLPDTFTIKGILNLWGGMGDSLLINRSNAIPMISFHGTADPLSPYDIGREFSCAVYPVALGSACLSRQLARCDVPYRLYLKNGAAHSPAVYRPTVTIPLAVHFFTELGTGKDMQSQVVME